MWYEQNIPKIRRGRGFTLIELLVVVGILVMLLAILVPSLEAARRAARLVVCMNNLKQMGDGNASYANDHNMRTVLAQDLTIESNIMVWQRTPQRFLLYGQLWKSYLRTAEVYYCPEATSVRADNPTVGAHQMGVPGQMAVGSYYQRGPYDGGPIRLGADRNYALIADVAYMRYHVPNHDGFIHTLYLDGSTQRLNIPVGWDNALFNHGRDSAPEAGDGAWAQLDRRHPE